MIHLAAIDVVLLATIIVVAIILAHLFRSRDHEAERRSAMAAAAERLGLEFKPGHDLELVKAQEFLDPLRRGEGRYAFNVLSGEHRGHSVKVFDSHFAGHSENHGRVRVHNYYCSALLLSLPRDFPEFTLTPETWKSRLIALTGKPDINFESDAFSKAFCVNSSNRRFAYDICHPAMMEFLLANRDLVVEIEGRTLALFFEKRLVPATIESNLSRLVQLRELLPEHLFVES